MTFGVRSRRAAAVALVLAIAAVPPAWAVPVRGVVRDAAGRPIETATVSSPTHRVGAVTDAGGAFVLELPEGPAVVVAQQIGYRAVRASIVVTPGLASLALVLEDEPVPLAEVTVAASSFGKTGKAEGPVLRRIDVVTTPGGAADVFQSLRALPGINAPTEGAAVYVRGGDPDETLIRLDGGAIGHPYHYERASGGLFSALDAYMLKSAFFSSGGFSAKYGGVLSGVLDIETADPMNLHTVSLGANLAGASASTSWSLVPDKLAFVGASRLGSPELLLRLYGSSTDFERPPVSADGVAKLIGRWSETGRGSLLLLDSGDRSKLLARLPNARALYEDENRTWLGALQLRDVIGGSLAWKGHLSMQRYRSDWTLGPFASNELERHQRASLDAVWALGSRHELSFGGNAGRHGTDLDARVPDDSTDWTADAPTRDLRTRARLDDPGLYLEDKLHVGGPVYATVGGRLDRVSTAETWTADPRAAVAWKIDDRQTLRVAAGRYHQPADATYLDPLYGNPGLGPLRAEHVIAGYEWLSDAGNVRLEAYRKDYDDLVTVDSLRWFTNGGHGFARGVDLFVQGSWRWLSGWMSYGWMESRRLENDDTRLVPSPFEVRHTLTLVGKYSLSSSWQVGARYGFGSGRPYTPVIGRTWDADRAVWHPIRGERGSARMPDYHRLDLRMTRLFSMPRFAGVPASSVCALYVEGMNVLGIRNVLEYTWNEDYSVRSTRDSYFSRALAVAGVALTW